jgi:Flp pilus assembly protein TadG
MFHGRRRDVRRARVGNATFTAVSVLCLLGFGALTVDIGHARMVRAQLQNAVDAAAHAAVLDIDGTDAGLVAALDAALLVGASNAADGAAVTLSPDDVVFGIHADGAFTPSTDAALVNAVVVSHQKLDVETTFGLAAFGVSTLGAGASALAVKPGPSPASAVSCYLPLAVPRCAIQGPGIFDFQASSNTRDTAGWAALPGADGTRPNADFLMQQLSGLDCIGAEIGSTIEAMNGNAGSATASALERINAGGMGPGPFTSRGTEFAAPDEWPVDRWADTPTASERMGGSGVSRDVFGQYGIAGPILLVSQDADADGEDDFCDDDDGDGLPDDPPNWTGEMTLEGFAYGLIYDGKTNGRSTKGTLRIRINTEFDFDDYATDGGGDVDYGLVFQEPARLMPAL